MRTQKREKKEQARAKTGEYEEGWDLLEAVVGGRSSLAPLRLLRGSEIETLVLSLMNAPVWLS